MDAQGSTEEPRKTLESSRVPRRAQEDPGDPRGTQKMEGGGWGGGEDGFRVSLRCHAVLDVAVMFLYNGLFVIL